MRYCLNGNLSPEVLKQADEIKIPYEYRNTIKKYTQKFPEAGIIMVMPNIDSKSIDWDEIETLNILAQKNFYLCLQDYSLAASCISHGIKFYFDKSINNWAEFNAVIEMGAAQVIIDAPLTHTLNIVRYRKEKSKELKIRAIPNIAYTHNYPRKNGVSGAWIRPEDVVNEYVETTIDIFEFRDCVGKEKEEALFKIYKRGSWPGDLEMLISHLDYPGVNRIIDPKISQKRMTCGQRCEEKPGSCHLCYNMLDLANENLVKNYLEDRE